MYSFIEYISEQHGLTRVFLIEAVSENTQGVLHELLVGYHLRGGKHMEKHKSADGNTPTEVHNQLAKTISKDEYEKISNRAKAAAVDLRAHIEKTGGRVHHVNWTSKSGDLKSVTGIDASQNEDSSDIVVTDHRGIHHGLSLKVSKKSKHVTLSNPGIGATYGGEKHLVSHRANLLKLAPELSKATNKKERKAILARIKAKTPKLHDSLMAQNLATLHKIAKHTHDKLTQMSGEDLVHHLRHNILHAHPTPMQLEGHNHIRHTTLDLDEKGDYQFFHKNPHKDYEHILKDHKNITVTHSGSNIYYHHKGIPFAKQNIKFNSQSDPFSAIQSSCTEVERKKDKINKAPVEKKKTVPPKEASFGGKKFYSESEQ